VRWETGNGGSASSRMGIETNIDGPAPELIAIKDAPVIKSAISSGTLLFMRSSRRMSAAVNICLVRQMMGW